MDPSRLSVEEIWLSVEETKVTRVHKTIQRNETYTEIESQKSKVSSEVFIGVLILTYFLSHRINMRLEKAASQMNRGNSVRQSHRAGDTASSHQQDS